MRGPEHGYHPTQRRIEPGRCVRPINGHPQLVNADNEDGMTGRLPMFPAIANAAAI
ncbi:hypothetical protein C7399_13950 [Paraburkholderia tropica]|uniref:Uncharacterized protein n=1 Tax=Paraburkholderia tropica TaxID=92647 RepID=A0ABX5MDD3_9BURK|nr:hypothetical protein C7400_13950 [Paraburkholderia tropica]PZW70929.1 hypothetical protein C7399_13950 [Paraburkholderia tropica]